MTNKEFNKVFKNASAKAVQEADARGQVIHSISFLHIGDGRIEFKVTVINEEKLQYSSFIVEFVQGGEK